MTGEEIKEIIMKLDKEYVEAREVLRIDFRDKVLQARELCPCDGLFTANLGGYKCHYCGKLHNYRDENKNEFIYISKFTYERRK